MKFIFRADANQTLGSGHVMRCQSLARVLRKRGADTCFAVLDLPDHLAALLAQDGHALKRLPESVRGDQMADALATLEGEEGLAGCILDHYQLGEIWEQAVQAHTELLALDDLGRPHAANWLLDPNFYADPVSRYEGQLDPNVRALLGPKFALLREEFECARRDAKVRDRGIKHILVSFGGMDADNVTGVALAAIDSSLSAEVEVTIIAGASHPALHELQAWGFRRKNASLKVQVSDMTPHLLAADLAIGAGGTSTWERCACGLPTIAVCLAENQREVIREGTSAGFLWGFDGVPAVQELAGVLIALAGAPGLLSHMSREALSITDARGARRVADLLMPHQIEIRLAAKDDAVMIYEWRTDPSVLGVSRNSKSFTFDEHQAWLRQTLLDPDRLLLIGAHLGKDIGVVRFDINNGRAEVSIFLLPETTGAGLGRVLLAAAEARLKLSRPDVLRVDAWVTEGNPGSLNMFKHLGYSPRISLLEKEFV